MVGRCFDEALLLKNITKSRLSVRVIVHCVPASACVCLCLCLCLCLRVCGSVGGEIATCQKGQTALICAARKSHPYCALLLIEAGADKEAKTNVRARFVGVVLVSFELFRLHSPMSSPIIMCATFEICDDAVCFSDSFCFSLSVFLSLSLLACFESNACDRLAKSQIRRTERRRSCQPLHMAAPSVRARC